MSVADRYEVLGVVRPVLAADYACSEEAFLDEGIVITPAEERPGRRRFPLRERPLGIMTMGAGVVVTCHADRISWLRASLGHLQRDAVFSAPVIAQLAQYIGPDRQVLKGPDPKYLCSQGDLRPARVPDGIRITVVNQPDVHRLYQHKEFPNALSYQTDSPRPDMIAVVASLSGEIVGIAAASADSDALWQIGVDVVVDARGRGIGRAIVGRLTQEVFRMGRVPYYSAAVSNIRSRALAVSLGYWPAWVELGARDRESVS